MSTNISTITTAARCWKLSLALESFGWAETKEGEGDWPRRAWIYALTTARTRELHFSLQFGHNARHSEMVRVVNHTTGEEFLTTWSTVARLLQTKLERAMLGYEAA